MFARLEDCQSHETRIATQEHNDFIHASTEVIKQVTKEVNGAKVPVWTPEEVEEVIVSQVPEMRSDNYGPTLNVWIDVSSRSFSCWLASTRPHRRWPAAPSYWPSIPKCRRNSTIRLWTSSKNMWDGRFFTRWIADRNAVLGSGTGRGLPRNGPGFSLPRPSHPRDSSLVLTSSQVLIMAIVTSLTWLNRSDHYLIGANHQTVLDLRQLDQVQPKVSTFFFRQTGSRVQQERDLRRDPHQGGNEHQHSDLRPALFGGILSRTRKVWSRAVRLLLLTYRFPRPLYQ